MDRDIKNACRRAGIGPCSSNDLRRSHATPLPAAGAAPGLIGKALGHPDCRMAELGYAKGTTETLGGPIAEPVGLPQPVTDKQNCSTIVATDPDFATFSGVSGQIGDSKVLKSLRPRGFEPLAFGFVVLHHIWPSPRIDNTIRHRRTASVAELKQ